MRPEKAMAKKIKASAAESLAAGINETPPLRRKCGAMVVHTRLLEDYPEFRQNLVEQERLVARRMASGSARRSGGPISIPVVVHVVYHLAKENISAAQIKSQIDVLNRDYRAQNPDRTKTPSVWSGLVSDAGIEFHLATTAPNGSTTDGITRTKTKQTSFGDDDRVKSSKAGGADPWPSANYLNIWVCNLGNGLLGYAQFPGGPAATDGVVILYKTFGTTGTVVAPYNLAGPPHTRSATGSTSTISGAIPSTARGPTSSPTPPISSNPTSASRPSPTSPAPTGPTATCS